MHCSKLAILFSLFFRLKIAKPTLNSIANGTAQRPKHFGISFSTFETILHRFFGKNSTLDGLAAAKTIAFDNHHLEIAKSVALVDAAAQVALR